MCLRRRELARLIRSVIRTVQTTVITYDRAVRDRSSVHQYVYFARVRNAYDAESRVAIHSVRVNLRDVGVYRLALSAIELS